MDTTRPSIDHGGLHLQGEATCTRAMLKFAIGITVFAAATLYALWPRKLDLGEESDVSYWLRKHEREQAQLPEWRRDGSI